MPCKLVIFDWNKGRHGTDPWPTPYCLNIFPTPQRLQNRPFTTFAYGSAWPSAGLGHVCSCLFSEMITVTLMGGHMTMARLTSGHGKKCVLIIFFLTKLLFHLPRFSWSGLTPMAATVSTTTTSTMGTAIRWIYIHIHFVIMINMLQGKYMLKINAVLCYFCISAIQYWYSPQEPAHHEPAYHEPAPAYSPPTYEAGRR